MNFNGMQLFLISSHLQSISALLCLH